MECCKYTKFGLCVKTELLRIGKTQNWLILKVIEKTGLFFDDSYLYKILIGERKAPKIVQAIREILDIKEVTEDDNYKNSSLAINSCGEK